MLRFLGLILILGLIPACSKSYKSCSAQTKPGVTETGCSVTGSDSAAAQSDAKSIIVKPWICEGKAQAWCFQGSDTIFTKVYPKMDKASCEILDDTRQHEVPMDKCAIPEADLLELKALFPEGIEILGLRKGVDDAGKPLYRVTYRSEFDAILKIFDAQGKSLPLDTPLNPDEWISEALRKDLQDSGLDAKEKGFEAIVKSQFTQKELKAKQTELIRLLKPHIQASEVEALQRTDSQSFQTFVFTTSYGKLRKLIPSLKPYLSQLGKAAVACNDGYPVFCQKQPDGTYKFGDPIRIETDECPIYKAPPDAVDDSFCRT